MTRNLIKKSNPSKTGSHFNKKIQDGDVYHKILSEIIYNHSKLLNAVQSHKYATNKDDMTKVTTLKGEIMKLVRDNAKNLMGTEEAMVKRIEDFLLGYGILEALIHDEDVSDIDFTRYNHCTIKKNGVKALADLSFESDRDFENFATLLIVRNGGVINADENHRRESDEERRLRINVTIPPRNVTGTSLLIRKHRMNPYTLKDLLHLEMLTKEESAYLASTFRHNERNVLFVGKGASGKTTLMRACLMETNPLNNYLVCEKDTELYLNDFENFIIQRIKKESDGGRKTTLKELVRDGLTMSVEGMVVGELVGDETYDLLSAANTDHVAYATAHTSGVYNTVVRLMTMIETGTRNITENVIKEIISGAVDDVVYMKDFKVKEIMRLVAYDRSRDTMQWLNVKKMLADGVDPNGPMDERYIVNQSEGRYDDAK